MSDGGLFGWLWDVFFGADEEDYPEEGHEQPAPQPCCACHSHEQTQAKPAAREPEPKKAEAKAAVKEKETKPGPMKEETKKKTQAKPAAPKPTARPVGPLGAMGNPYLPYPVKIDDIILENEAKDLKTFKLVFADEKDEKAFDYMPGQFAEISIFGKGESPIGIASSPSEKGHLLFTIKKTGIVTDALHAIEKGSMIGVRGPLGIAFPWERMKGKNIVIVAGGFAFTTLRSAIVYMLDPAHRKDYGKITAIYGARSPGELLYKEDLDKWQASDEIEMHVTVDKGDEDWKGREGFVPTVLGDVKPSADDALCIVCGPPIMLKFTLPVIDELGFSPEDTILSLENRMKCGIGKCGRCNIGAKYVCKHGPVFTYEELKELPPEY